MRLYENRKHAAEDLAEKLEFMRAENPIVFGLMNGGVILAEVVANHLDATLDVMLIEKLAAPKIPQHVVGVVDEHGRISMIESTARWHHLTSQQMVKPAREAFELLQKRRVRIRELLPEADVRNRSVLLVDEGVNTGARMLGAISSLRDRGAKRIVVAAPAGASKATWQLRDNADVVVIPHQPSKLKGFDRFYKNFPTISDETVIAIVERHVISHPQGQPLGVRTLQINVENSIGLHLNCLLDLPPGTGAGAGTGTGTGIGIGSGPAPGPAPAVIFAHGFESNSISQRNVPISQRLAKRGIVGVRMDFTGHGRSEGTMEQATDEQMLDDLKKVCAAVARLREVDPRRIGVVGSGTGGLIALQFAAHEPLLGSLVLRGPVCGDERELVRQIRIPTLIIHAEGDTALEDSVNILNDHLPVIHECMRISDSNRLFGDPISMELMINATVEWLTDHLSQVRKEIPPPILQTTEEPTDESAPDPDPS